MKKIIFICAVVIVLSVFGKRPPEGTLACMKYAVMVSAQVKEKPLQIILQWKKEKCFSYTIYRRFLGEKEWSPTPIACLSGDASGYIDKRVKVGAVYEYRIDRAGKGFIGRSYICSGINIPLVEQRGKIILLVEKGVAPALKNELKRLELDMLGDGWRVIRYDVSREEKASNVKKIIIREYNKDPKQVKSVFLFGHIPVPYSGSLCPDGHKNHKGAWPADLYYGDIDGDWPDKKEHKYVNTHKQKNVPGDGKLDPSTVKPNSIELEVGRVDLADMPTFGNNETELLRQYLNKDHFFRHKLIKVQERALVDDNFGSFKGEAFGSSAWSNFSTFFTADKVKAADFIFTLKTEDYLWGYGSGGGHQRGAGGVGNTGQLAKNPPKAVFTMLFGSYFGDWDRQDNFMRAPLASSGYVLTCAWDGRPHWYFHHMALGKNIGYSALRTQNNHSFRDYLACNDTKTIMKNDSEWAYNSIHVALLGDPTLRMHPIEAPREIELTGQKLKWAPVKTEGLIGYKVYVAESFKEQFECLTPISVTANEFAIKNYKQGSIYMVKTIALTKSGSGTYVNSSQGVFARLLPGKSVYKSLTLKDQTISIKEDQPLTIGVKPLGGSDKVVMWSSLLVDNTGRIELTENHKYCYIPELDYSGTCRMLMVARDDLNDSNPAQIKINIEPVADKPRGINQKFCLASFEPFEVDLQAYDPDDEKQVLTYKITKQPRYGKLSGTPPKVIYRASENIHKIDSFQFAASDGKLESKPATITIERPYFCYKSTQEKKIDGDISDWEKAAIVCNNPEEFRISNEKSWQGIEDNLSKLRVCYDQKYLYIAVEVTDDELNSKKSNQPWTQDGIEFRLDARPGKVRVAGKGKNEMKDILFLALSPNTNANDPWLYKTKIKLPAGTKYACVKTERGFSTEIAVPIAYLIEKGGINWDGFRLNYCIDDLDRDGMVQIWWKPSWRHSKNYSGSGCFVRK